MLFKTLILSVLLCASLVAANKKQKNVRPDHDCSCKGYVAKATECNWPDKTCNEATKSEVYKNYLYWCRKLNAFRSAKREGYTKAEYNRTLTCQSNLSRTQRDAIYANEQPAPAAKYLYQASEVNAKVPFTTVPVTSIDWTDKFPPVKNQGSCGSCWAFAVVGYFEAYRSIFKSQPVTALSEQHLVNCDGANKGCKGGFTGSALDFLFNVGTTLSTDIPYTGVQLNTSCPATKPVFKTDNQAYYEYYIASQNGTQGVTNPNGNCLRLRQLLTRGPVIASMHVDSGFYQYKSGAYMSSTCMYNGTTNHAMIVVGYGPIPSGTSPEVYGFKVRNSWGATWGSAGHIWVADNDRVCSLCSKLVYA